MNKKEVIFLIKATSEGESMEKDNFVETLRSEGYVIKLIPCLDFIYKNMDELKIKLLKPDQYSGIIFTSPRCVKAVEKAIGSELSVLDKWRELKSFTVGQTTAKLAKDRLKLELFGGDCGNEKTLAPVIINYNLNKPLLAPVGNLHGQGRETLEDQLAKGNVDVDSVEVYETIPHPQLETDLMAAIAEQEPDCVVYFSPSGISYTQPIFRESGLNYDKVKWVAIGPTTATAMSREGLEVYNQALLPQPQFLLQAISSPSFSSDICATSPTAFPTSELSPPKS